MEIPIFTSQLEKSREAVDAANIRAAYAEVMTAKVTGDTTNQTKQVEIKQQKADWSTTIDWPADLKGANANVVVGGIATIEYDDSNSNVKVTYSAKATTNKE